MAPTNKNETDVSVGIKRYLAIMAAKTIGLALTVGFIFSVVSGALPVAQKFVGDGVDFAKESQSGYKDQPQPKQTSDPVAEALVKIHAEYASADPESYIISQNGPSLPASAAAGNVLLLTKNNAINTTSALKDFSKTDASLIENAIGVDAWLKIVDESHVEVLSLKNGIRCDIDLSINEATGCVVP